VIEVPGTLNPYRVMEKDNGGAWALVREAVEKGDVQHLIAKPAANAGGCIQRMNW
jgi:hypothetical protein